MKLDDALDGIRNSSPDLDTTRAAADAVRARLGLDEPALASGRIENCAGFQARIPDFVAGRLSEAEALLVQDHTRECVPCRRALIAARAGADAAHDTPRRSPARVASPRARFAAAAAAILVLVLGGWGATRLIAPAPEDLNVVATDGGLWRLENGTAALLAAGTSVRETDAVRTERGAGAVLRMADGSRIEMRESTQLRVDRRRDGATIRLAQGSIIVEASKQGSGHLDVATGDAVVSVKGTIFTVNAGLAGSRVAVLEGAVQVDAGGRTQVLNPGDQIASRPGLAPAPLRDAFAWSRDAARYDVVLAELKSLRADLDAGVSVPPARHATRMLDLAPDGTVVYFALPNLTRSIGDATRIIRDHLDRSETLRDWWRGNVDSAEAEADLERGLAKLDAVGRELGDEIVVTFARGAQGRLSGPVFLAELKAPESFRAVAQREGLTAIPDLELRIQDGLLVAGPRGALPNAMGAPSAFATTAFHDRLAEAYRDGTGWIFGADLETIVSGGDAARAGVQGLAALGADGMRHLIVEREENGAGTHTSANLTFTGPRRGVASWLAEPGPMGGLAFISPDANFVVSVLLREPGVAVQELFAQLSGDDPGFQAALDRFRATSGVDPVADLAGPLGGEFTFAIDGPVLPTPSWKAVVEVYDPARLQNTIGILVDRINTHLAEAGQGGSLALTPEVVDGRTWYTVRAAGPMGVPVEAVYTFDRGYLVAAPSRALVNLALQTRDNGTGLASSARFRELLPAENRTDFSAVVYENAAPLLAPLAHAAGPASEPAKALEAITGDGRAHLIYAFAGADRIEVASRTFGGLGSEIGRLFSLIGARGPRAAVQGNPGGGDPAP